MALLLNFMLYQAIWFLCVFKGNSGASIGLTLIAVHVLLSSCRTADLKIMALLLSCGLVIDGAIHWAGFISYPLPAYPIPFWLAVIWLALALMVHHSLRWLKGRPLLSALCGLVGGPLAYGAGVAAGAATFEAPPVHVLGLLSVVWAILWPAVMYVGALILPKHIHGLDGEDSASADLSERVADVSKFAQ
jgi:hypothetical protein